MIKGNYVQFGESLHDIYNIRMQCECTNTILECKDEMDSEAIHVVTYENEKPIATGRLLIINNEFKIDKLYVLPDKRREKIGDFTMRLLIEKANIFAAKNIYCKVNNLAIPFLKSLGFSITTDNNEFYKVMVLNIDNYYKYKKCY